MKKTTRILGILLAAALLAGLGLMAVHAAGVAGTEEDPLVTLSYLTEVFTAKVTELFHTELGERETALREDLGGRIEALEAAAGLGSETWTYRVETFQDGQTVVCQRGTEILLRIGEAVVAAPDYPGLIDTSTAGERNDGESLGRNHLYMVTISRNGFRAAGTVKAVIRGEYTIEG